MSNKRKRYSSQERIDKYKRKIKELESKHKRKRRRVIIQSSSESESDPSTDAAQVLNEGNLCVPDNETVLEDFTPGQTLVEPDNVTSDNPSLATQPENTDLQTIPLVAATDNAVPTTNPEATLPELDPELLLALGEETGNKPKYGAKIHQSLADRWEPILKKGFEKETREKSLKEHPVPENCTLLQAPKLNVEVAAAVSETTRNRDKKKESDQKQLGIGITAISKAMEVLLTSDNKIEAIKLLGEGCRILADLHYQQTQSRISVINYSLAKPFLNVVQDCERDETLYGSKLSQKIKASKVIEKQGMQIKKYTKTPKSTSTDKTATNTRPQYQQGSPATNQGNWSGPPRYQYQQNRGERKGQRGATAAQSRRSFQPTATPSAAGPAQPRAPPRS